MDDTIIIVWALVWEEQYYNGEYWDENVELFGVYSTPEIAKDTAITLTIIEKNAIKLQWQKDDIGWNTAQFEYTPDGDGWSKKDISSVLVEIKPILLDDMIPETSPIIDASKL